MRALLAGLGAIGCLSACIAPADPPPETSVTLRALDWLAPAADPVTHLTTQPAACVPGDMSDAARRGELLFNSPLLLGGQAAKAGLSCASCHRNGRGNPNFVFQGISAAPGTADVTNALFGHQRADREFNPVPIPDLAGPEGQIQVDRDDPGALEAFLRAQIIEEFSGQPPSLDVIDDVAAYIRAINAQACPADAVVAQSWHDEVARVDTAVRAMTQIDEADQRPYRQAARAALGRLHARFPAPAHLDLRTELESLSAALAEGELPSGALNALADGLDAAAPRSLYDAETLADALD